MPLKFGLLCLLQNISEVRLLLQTLFFLLKKNKFQ
ncbi:hypothetical protein SLEP1_g37482 [Rubroshorea leprosula]|uniref:Uncharacterized protein n=1 Tax=Rubroshorea leprosula TaxID=152421 RepID=A0AAV5KVB4_9ROSI|nr:hypothetical protein SLEP1_g37482 [Rubroshorea leprosula]